MSRPLDFAPYIRAALASLQSDGPTGLAALIAAYNAEAGNTHDLEVPAETAYYFGGDDTDYVFPKVEVAVPNGLTGDFSLRQADGEQTLSVSVAVWLEGETGDIPEMHEKVLGYGRVASEVLLQPEAFGPGVTVQEVRAAYPMIPAGAINPDTHVFEKWKTLAALEFDLEDIARRP